MVTVKEASTMPIVCWVIAENFVKIKIGVFIVTVKVSLLCSVEKCLMWGHVFQFWEKTPDVFFV